MNPFLLQLINLALQIAARHQAGNPAAPPLTADQVTAMLVAEVAAGENRDLKWFLSKNFPPPE